jgi:hypothetical protein
MNEIGLMGEESCEEGEPPRATDPSQDEDLESLKDIKAPLAKEVDEDSRKP